MKKNQGQRQSVPKTEWKQTNNKQTDGQTRPVAHTVVVGQKGQSALLQFTVRPNRSPKFSGYAV